MPQVNITAFRHGIANYVQTQVALSEANDLTKEGIAGVVHSAKQLVVSISNSEKILIISSPYGRALQTSKIIFNVLRDENFSFVLRNPSGLMDEENSIVIDGDIDEVRNFDLNLFKTFVFGGKINGVVLSEKMTNPAGLDFSEYFNQRAWGHDAVQAPAELIKQLKKIENPAATSNRLDVKLGEIRARKFLEPTHVILVTHQGVMCNLSENVVEPADFITISG